MAEIRSAVQPDFPGEPLAVVAGGGDLPQLVADRAARDGWLPQMLAVGDGIGRDWAPYPALDMAWGRLGNAILHLRRGGVRRLVLCGTVSVRPDFGTIRPSLRTLALLPQILGVIRGGDDSLLRKAARAFERRGFELLAVQELVPELIMPAGLLTRRLPSKDETAAMDLGFKTARLLGALDIGQAVVASKDRVIAMEGIEGTREMMTRVADLRRRGRIGARERIVLVKGAKPEQDLRFDLPSIGVATIEEAAAAGLSGVALSAGRALVIRFNDVVAAADKADLFLAGRSPANDEPAGERL